CRVMRVQRARSFSAEAGRSAIATNWIPFEENMRSIPLARFAFAFALACLRESEAISQQPPLAEGKNGVVVGTTGPAAVHAGLEALKNGGSAADAAAATALAQVVECGGAYVSHAGIFSMVYFDAATGKTYFLNACYNTVLDEKAPLTIPGR